MDEGDDCPLNARVWVQAPIDEHTEYASVLITSDLNDEGITVKWDYDTDNISVESTDNNENTHMQIAVSNKVVGDQTVLNRRGYEIDTVGHFDITVTGATDPVLSEIILLLVEDNENRS